MVAGDEIGQQSACTIAQLIHGMNGSRRRVINPAGAFYMCIFFIEPTFSADVVLECRAVFAQVMP